MASASRFKKRSRSERLENVRSERATAVPEEPKLVFNFKDFDASQSVSQSFEAWQKAGKLADLMVKLQHLSQWSLTEAIAEKQVAVYRAFPAGSDFRPPKHIAPDGCSVSRHQRREGAEGARGGVRHRQRVLRGVSGSKSPLLDDGEEGDVRRIPVAPTCIGTTADDSSQGFRMPRRTM